MKRGALDTQFNWIFILIIGGLIIGGFALVINNQGKQSTLELAIDMKQNLNLVLESVSGKDEYEQSIRFPLQTTFFCEDATSFYELAETGITQDTSSTPFFSPTKLGPGLVFARAEQWQRPIPISNMLYLTDSLHHYLFLYTSENRDEMLELYNLLPNGTAKELLTGQEYNAYEPNENHYYITVRSGVLSTNDFYVDPINTRYDGVLVSFERDKVVFIENYGQDDSKAIDVWEKRAAMYTADKFRYECERKKAFFNAQVTYELAILRADKLYNDAPATCAAKYARMGSSFTVLNTADAELLVYEQAIRDLDATNTDLVRNNCPPLY